MNTPRSIDDVMNEMNDQAKAEGRYLGKAFWEVPPRPGPILDIPDTEKSKADLAWFRQRRRERTTAASEPMVPVRQHQDEVGEAIRKDFWEIPRCPGSILDVPETPEGKERVARLRACVAELKQEQAMNKTCVAIEIEEVTDADEIARARKRREQFQRNKDWLQAHVSEVYSKCRGQCICIAGQELFAADTAREAIAQARAAHPHDEGCLTRYVPREKAARIYAV